MWVTQLEIQRASLIQEPFYDAITRLFLQVYQATANVGKRVYIANQRKLAIAIGDAFTTVLQLTDEYNAEDFRVFIFREPDKRKQQEAANELLVVLKDRDLLDDIRFSKLFNKGTFDDISSAMQSYAQEKMAVAKELEKRQSEQGQQMAMQEEDRYQQEREDKNLSEAGKFADNEQNRKSKEAQTRMKLADNAQRKREPAPARPA